MAWPSPLLASLRLLFGWPLLFFLSLVSCCVPCDLPFYGPLRPLYASLFASLFFSRTSSSTVPHSSFHSPSILSWLMLLLACFPCNSLMFGLPQVLVRFLPSPLVAFRSHLFFFHCNLLFTSRCFFPLPHHLTIREPIRRVNQQRKHNTNSKHHQLQSVFSASSWFASRTTVCMSPLLPLFAIRSSPPR